MNSVSAVFSVLTCFGSKSWNALVLEEYCCLQFYVPVSKQFVFRGWLVVPGIHNHRKCLLLQVAK